MSFDKLKILTLKKPLSLTQQAQMLNTFGKEAISQTTSEKSSQTSQKVSGLIKDKTQKAVPSKPSPEDKTAKLEIQKQRLERQKQAIKWLTQTFPDCFNLDHPQPLKIGITKDLIEFSKSQNSTETPSHLSLRKTLNFYTQRRQYHQAILHAPHRYDLDGKAVQKITPEERSHAQEKLEQLEKRSRKGQEQKQTSSPVPSPSEKLP